jgi:hypothetical protein
VHRGAVLLSRILRSAPRDSASGGACPHFHPHPHVHPCRYLLLQAWSAYTCWFYKGICKTFLFSAKRRRC